MSKLHFNSLNISCMYTNQRTNTDSHFRINCMTYYYNFIEYAFLRRYTDSGKVFDLLILPCLRTSCRRSDDRDNQSILGREFAFKLTAATKIIRSDRSCIVCNSFTHAQNHTSFSALLTRIFCLETLFSVRIH